MTKQRSKEIAGVHIPVLINNRCYVMYERMTGHSAEIVNGVEDSLALFFCSLKAGALEDGIDFKMDFESFITYTDHHPDLLNDTELTDVGDDAKNLNPEKDPVR